jgi:hypothetical protein
MDLKFPAGSGGATVKKVVLESNARNLEVIREGITARFNVLSLFGVLAARISKCLAKSRKLLIQRKVPSMVFIIICTSLPTEQK